MSKNKKMIQDEIENQMNEGIKFSSNPITNQLLKLLDDQLNWIDIFEEDKQICIEFHPDYFTRFIFSLWDFDDLSDLYYDVDSFSGRLEIIISSLIRNNINIESINFICDDLNYCDFYGDIDDMIGSIVEQIESHTQDKLNTYEEIKGTKFLSPVQEHRCKFNIEKSIKEIDKNGVIEQTRKLLKENENLRIKKWRENLEEEMFEEK